MSELKSKYRLEAEALIAKNTAAWNAIKQATRDYEEKYWNDNKESLQAQGYSYTKDPKSLWGGVWSKQAVPQSPAVTQTVTKLNNISLANTNKGLDTSSKTPDDGEFEKESQVKYKNTSEQVDKTTTSSVTQPKVVSNSTNVSGITEYDFRNNKHFRNIHGFKPNATIAIEGKTYPIMATTGLFGSASGVENDRIYAFDPETGMIRAVWENFMGMPHNKWADNSAWIIPNWMAGPEYEWKKANPMPSMRGPLGGGFTPEYETWLEKYKAAKAAGFKKQGGTMNRIKYFQQGGAAPQQDMQQQVVALVQAAMLGDEKATQTVNKIMEAAKAGDQQAVQIAQMIQQVVQQMQGQATAAKWGAKLGYIRSLKFANGGKACPACQAGAPIQKVEEKACGGKAKKAKKRYFGGWL